MKLFQKHRLVSIRSRLFAGFVLMTLLPAIAFSIVSGLVGLSRGRQQAINQLESVATLKEAELNTWLFEIQSLLANMAIEQTTMNHIITILSSESGTMTGSDSYNGLHDYFDRILETSSVFEEIFLDNPNRSVVFSTQLTREGKLDDPTSQIYLREGLKGEYVHPPTFGLSVGRSTIVAVRPIKNAQGESIGILAGRVSTEILNEIMLERTGLGQTGETYLMMENFLPLTTVRFPEGVDKVVYRVFTQASDDAINHNIDGSGVYANYQGINVLGVYRWLPKLRVALIAEQHESEALSITYTTLWINAGVAAVMVLIATLVSIYYGQSIAGPLNKLVGFVRRIPSRIPEDSSLVHREDEIGILSQAFTTMSSQIHSLITNLDQQVHERTVALRRRAIQLETSASVSREVTSILNIDDLLTRVVELIQDAFNFYYVSIFLVDDKSPGLVFKAGIGVRDSLFSSQGFRLPIDSTSLNGQTALAGQAVLVNDVSTDQNYMKFRQLPDTQSELVIPLMIGKRVLGTLDMQSSEKNAFDSDELHVMQGLGDQVAIAIENATLYEQSRTLAIVEERNRLARELHDSVTQSLYTLVLFSGAGQELTQIDKSKDLPKHLIRMEEIARQALKEMRLLLYELRPLALDAEGLQGALKQRLDTVERRAGILAQLEMDEGIELDPSSEEVLYKIAQEALNNSLKHSEGKSVFVRVTAEEDQVVVEVTDDGIGFNYDEAVKKGGLGLMVMKERAEALGGNLEIFTSPGQGTRVMVTIERQKSEIKQPDQEKIP